jgi:hypothetical protein
MPAINELDPAERWLRKRRNRWPDEDVQRIGGRLSIVDRQTRAAPSLDARTKSFHPKPKER